MTRTFRHVLMSTSLGLAMAILQMPGVHAQDSTSCMQDVQMLREQASLGKGADSSIEASASAAEEACIAGDYGQASAYIADAQQRINLREAQRDDFGATGSLGTAATETEAALVGGAAFGDDDDSVADDVESAADDAAGEIEDVADDAGDEIADVADDAGDELDDVGDDIADGVDDLVGDDDDEPSPEAIAAAENFRASLAARQGSAASTSVFGATGGSGTAQSGADGGAFVQ